MSNLNKYLKLRAKIKELQNIEKMLKEEVSKELNEVGGTYKTKIGTLYTSSRTYYSYPSDVKQKTIELKNQISEIEQKAKDDGRVEEREVLSVGFRSLE